MPSRHWDETWRRLHRWTDGQGPSERLSAQVLLAEAYRDLDPSHPLGGRDGGKDAVATKDGQRWVMAVYFPGKQQTLNVVQKKFVADFAGVAKNDAHGMVFVTNQELSLADRETLATAVDGPTEIYHLERITAVLDQPRMGAVRRQFGLELIDESARLEAVQTGGDSFAYFMLYDFDFDASQARNLCLIRVGEFALYDVRMRLTEMTDMGDVGSHNWGELNSPADCVFVTWPLMDRHYYRAFFHARNGNWHQDLILRRSESAGCWLAATRVTGHQQAPAFQHLDSQFEAEFGVPEWMD